MAGRRILGQFGLGHRLFLGSRRLAGLRGTGCVPPVEQREPPRASRLDVERFFGQFQPAHGVAGNFQPHGLQFKSIGQTVEQQRRRDAIETAAVECLAQIAGLQVVAAAEDRLVQEREHRLGPFAGRAADLAGAAQGFDERVEPLAVTAQFVVAIDPAGDQSGLQQRELAEAAVVDLREEPLFQIGKARREDFFAAGQLAPLGGGVGGPGGPSLADQQGQHDKDDMSLDG